VLILRKICKGLLGKPYSEMYSESLEELFFCTDGSFAGKI
jgi:hypothetical protein